MNLRAFNGLTKIKKSSSLRLLASTFLKLFGRQPLPYLTNHRNRFSLLSFLSKHLRYSKTRRSKEIIILLANGRTGTHALQSAFPDEHYEKYGEYLNPAKKPFHRNWFPNNITQYTRTLAELTCQKDGAIFMIKPEDLPMSFDYSLFYKQCKEEQFLIVFIQREDIFAQAHSSLKAKKMKTWNTQIENEAKLYRQTSISLAQNDVLNEALFYRLIESRLFPAERTNPFFNFITSEDIFRENYSNLKHHNILLRISTKKMSGKEKISPPKESELRAFFSSIKVPFYT